MPATEKNANAFDMTTLSAVNSGYSLMLINNSTNEGQLITMTDLATMILNEIRNQTFTATELGQAAASTLPAAISSLNSAIALSQFDSSGIVVRSGFEYLSGGIMPLGSLYFVEFRVTVTEAISASTSFRSVAGSFGKKAPVSGKMIFASCTESPSKRIYANITTAKNLRFQVLDDIPVGNTIAISGWYLHA